MTQPSAPGPITLSTVLWIAVSTGLATAVFNQFIGWLREAMHDRASTKRDARYLAIRLAVMLEEFAIKCADRIGDNDLYRQTKGSVGTKWDSIPELPPYPDEADWRSLAPGLLSRVLTLRNALSLKGGGVVSGADWGNYSAAACDSKCGKGGFVAWTLARDLRAHYGLKPFDPHETAWIVEVLKRFHDKATSSDADP
jgi:hypothetical protein